MKSSDSKRIPECVRLLKNYFYTESEKNLEAFLKSLAEEILPPGKTLLIVEKGDTVYVPKAV